ncbi:hypothetical protein GCM10009546_13120 [Actinomadura livida]|uniref:Uncharacterized protein n=1 Tax=Actinomadura livida TaxID=79909 RepID=A0ABP3NVP1_9ACTN|nr:hypothetical protein GCM10010208_60200 [Actinomadura livida]
MRPEVQVLLGPPSNPSSEAGSAFSGPGLKIFWHSGGTGIPHHRDAPANIPRPKMCRLWASPRCVAKPGATKGLQAEAQRLLLELRSRGSRIGWAQGRCSVGAEQEMEIVHIRKLDRARSRR